MALAVLVAGGQLSTAVHLLLVHHLTCAEHGELIHADGAPDEPRPPADLAIEGDGGSAAHGHDHCTAMCQAAQGVTAAPAADSPVAFHDAGAPAADLIDDPPAPVALLHLAPKSSPPA